MTHYDDILARADGLANYFENDFNPTHVDVLENGEWQRYQLAREGDKTDE